MYGVTLGIWQAITSPTCDLYQQNTIHSAGVSTTGNDVITPTVTSSAVWSNPQPIFTDIDSCPQGDRLVPHPDQNQIYWLWGEGTNALALTIWDINNAQWTLPLYQTINFEDPDSGEIILLGDLHATFPVNRIAVVGTDSDHDVWFTEANFYQLESAFSSPLPWSQEKLAAQTTVDILSPVLAMDSGGRSHLGASVIYYYTY